MDPFSLALMLGGTALGGVGSILGAGASSEAASANNNANIMNYYARERERRDRIRAADEAKAERGVQQREAKLGTTDAQGNRTRFIEGVGWVTSNSAETDELRNEEIEFTRGQRDFSKAQQDAQLDVINKDVPLERAAREKNFLSQSKAGLQADALMRAFTGLQKEDPRMAESLIYGKASGAINEAFDDQAGDALKSNLRTSGNNAGAIIGSIGKKRADALSKAAVDAAISADSKVDADYSNERGQLAQLISAFSGMAGKPIDARYSAQNVNTAAPAQQSTEAAGSLKTVMSALQGLQMDDGNKALIEAFGAKGGTLDYQQPDYGMANALASIGSSISGVGNSIGSANRLNDRRKTVNY